MLLSVGHSLLLLALYSQSVIHTRHPVMALVALCVVPHCTGRAPRIPRLPWPAGRLTRRPAPQPAHPATPQRRAPSPLQALTRR